ncbi:hypothetical protein [Pseudomonas sp. Choline-02u-1]|uniref:hypothetical protein n=1 Tax=unclassified Pseudomonas TaxID=196821 RepID=UPI0012FF180C|nr:hypothetical protein [Pseudomonas sp. Choline-02u-1]
MNKRSQGPEQLIEVKLRIRRSSKDDLDFRVGVTQNFIVKPITGSHKPRSPWNYTMDAKRFDCTVY